MPIELLYIMFCATKNKDDVDASSFIYFRKLTNEVVGSCLQKMNEIFVLKQTLFLDLIGCVLWFMQKNTCGEFFINKGF